MRQICAVPFIAAHISFALFLFSASLCLRVELASMHLAILANADSWYARDLIRAAAGRHTITVLGFRDLVSELTDNQLRIKAGEFDLSQADAVLVRTMPPGSLEQVVFRMDLLARLQAAGTPVFNPPKALEAAVDKYLASTLLAAAGLTTPDTLVCQTADQAMEAFAQLDGDVVLKPLFGAEGRGIARLNDEALALRAFKLLEPLGAVFYLQRFIQHEGCDLRLLVIGERVLAMRRRNPLDWRTNISRGATAEAFEPDSQLVETARRAAAAVGAPLAGVDILPGCDGRFYTIEVNAVPGWKALAQATSQDVAALVLDYLSTAIVPQCS
jgi:ribosomal protein S6--L-glutamate ligase